MKKLIYLAILFVVFGTKINAQTASTTISSSQLMNTWYEWPNESPNSTTLIFHLTPYTVIVGKDFFQFDPATLKLAGNNQFMAEFLKSKNADPVTKEMGTWQLNSNKLTVNVNNQSRTYKVQSVDSSKLVLIIE
jgi:hypothetical protein